MSASDSAVDSAEDAVRAVRRLATQPTARAGAPGAPWSERHREKVLAIRRGLAEGEAAAARGAEAAGAEAAGGAAGGARGAAARKKKRRRVNVGSNPRKLERCSSPSHFHVRPDDEAKFGPDFMLDLPDRECADRLLRAVGSAFYHHRHVPDGTFGKKALHPHEYDLFEYATLDVVVSPVRKPRVWDTWAPKEIALFEAGICKYGKDFRAVAGLIEGKSTQEVVHFYYTAWKGSAHHRAWKASAEAGAAKAGAGAPGAGAGGDAAPAAYLKPPRPAA